MSETSWCLRSCWKESLMLFSENFSKQFAFKARHYLFHICHCLVLEKQVSASNTRVEVALQWHRAGSSRAQPPGLSCPGRGPCQGQPGLLSLLPVPRSSEQSSHRAQLSPAQLLCSQGHPGHNAASTHKTLGDSRANPPAWDEQLQRTARQKEGELVFAFTAPCAGDNPSDHLWEVLHSGKRTHCPSLHI